MKGSCMESYEEYMRSFEENAKEEAWMLAKEIAGFSHIIRMQLFHEYELRKILDRYTYDEAKAIVDKFKLAYTE